MRVLHILGSIDKSLGGPSRSVPQTCEQLSLLGVNITLVTRPSADAVKLNTSKFLEVKFLSLKELFVFGNSISKDNVDLIHLQHIWVPYIHIMAWWARKKNIPYIITPRGMLEPWIMQRNSLKKKLGMLLYQRKDIQKATYIHATCKLEEKNIRSLGFTNSIRIIPNGVDITKFVSSYPKKVNSPKKILFLSRIHQKKGIEFLIEAWSQLNSKLRENWVVEIIGNGNKDYIHKLNLKIQNLNLQHQLQIKEPVFGVEKVKIFRQATLFVLPTYSENFGIVVAEALASFTPVITTKGTPWEELEAYNCGWWINIGIQPLKEALEIALNKEENDLKEMSLNGRKLIENKYSIEQVGSKMFDFYKEINTANRN